MFQEQQQRWRDAICFDRFDDGSFTKQSFDPFNIRVLALALVAVGKFVRLGIYLFLSTVSICLEESKLYEQS